MKQKLDAAIGWLFLAAMIYLAIHFLGWKILITSAISFSAGVAITAFYLHRLVSTARDEVRKAAIVLRRAQAVIDKAKQP